MDDHRNILRDKQNFFIFHFVTGMLFIVALVDFIFDYGSQLMPFSPKENWKLKNPECSRLRDYNLTFKNGKITFWARTKSTNMLAPYHFWRLFRLVYKGYFFTTDIRFSEYTSQYSHKMDGNDVMFLDFDTDQAGKFDYTLYCLDEPIENGSYEFPPDQINLSERTHTLFFQNNSLAHVCRKEGKDIVFTYANASKSIGVKVLSRNAEVKQKSTPDFLIYYNKLPSCVLLEFSTNRSIDIMMDLLLPAHRLSTMEVPVAVNSAIDDPENIKLFAENVLKRKFDYTYNESNRMFCWTDSLKYNFHLTIDDLNKSDFDAVKTAIFPHQLETTTKFVTNVPIDFYNSLKLNVPAISIYGKSFLQKLIEIQNARYYIYFDDEDEGVLAGFLPDDCEIIVIPKTREINGQQVPYFTDAIKIIAKTEKKFHISTLDQLQNTISKHMKL